MHRLPSTVVCVVGPQGAPDVLDSALAPLTSASNVTLVRPDRELPAADRAVAAWRGIRGAATPYVVHDADPFADVAAAWVARYDGAGAVGDLEVAVTAAVGRLRRDEIGLPDSLVLLDPEGWSATRRHWYLGVLGGAAPTRVVPLRPGLGGLAGLLPALPSGRWWPEPPQRLLDGIDRIVPDRVGVPGTL